MERREREPDIDTRVLKEDYRNHDLIARYWDGEYRGRVWKNKLKVADQEGRDLDSLMAELRQIVDRRMEEKRKALEGRSPTAEELTAALGGIAAKLKEEQKRMLAAHARARNASAALAALQQVGELSGPQYVLRAYVDVARRLCNELALPAGAESSLPLLLQDAPPQDTIRPEQQLQLRPEVAKAVEELQW